MNITWIGILGQARPRAALTSAEERTVGARRSGRGAGAPSRSLRRRPGPSRGRSKTTAALVAVLPACAASTSRAVVARQQAAHQRLAVAGLDDRAVAQDERQRPRQLLEDRPREVVAAAGRQRHLDARVDRPRDRVAVRRREAGRGCRAGCRRCRGRAGGSLQSGSDGPQRQIGEMPMARHCRLRSLTRVAITRCPSPRQHRPRPRCRSAQLRYSGNCTRSSPTIWRLMMSPKTCCWTSWLARLITFSDVVSLVVGPAHAEAAVDERVGLGRAVVAVVEHVLPERAVGVADRQVAEEPAVVEVDADVEAVLRREVQLARCRSPSRLRLGLPRVVHEHVDVVVDRAVSRRARAPSACSCRSSGR